nr:HIT family protein [Halobacillus litoralis]
MKSKSLLDSKYKPEGFNIGVNCGEAAGQTIYHCHIHLIPRYSNDIDNPLGGVRGVIPQKRLYK